MIYLGSFSYFSDSLVPFRVLLLSDNLKPSEMVIDNIHSWERGTAVRVSQKAASRWVATRFKELSQHLYVYTLFLYEDQDGQLYDTEHLDVFRFTWDMAGTKVVRPRVDKNHSGTGESYHRYSADERNSLKEFLSRTGHPIAASLFPSSQIETK